ncbi:hypothetical protein [Conexibacter sp. DBS9H8]|uniref:hypothetical protein n=1 Tax=Conexibacter sp. DBS9H8 TaxID=2937801 RepID=UPI00200F27EF|nr:hypothetical protein [Conexibacter sp. DBS9H8]
MKRLVLMVVALAATVGLLSAPAALAATASGTPTVTTGPASQVTPTTATVSGTVNLNGASTSTASLSSTCYFAYGTTTSYGSTAPCATAPSATGTSTVTANLSNLTGGQVYHYELEIVTGGLLGVGATTTGGGDASFITPSASVPPQLATTAVSDLGGSGVTLNGTVNPEQWGISSCSFSYAANGAAATVVNCANLPSPGATTQPVSAPVTGLSPGTTYTYDLMIVYGAGKGTTLSTASSGSFTTLAATIGTPANLTSTSATLNGTVDPEGQTVTACAFYYGVSGPQLQTVPCTLAADQITGTSPVAVNANVTGLTANTKYIDTVVLTTAQGPVIATPATFTTPPVPPQPSATTLAATGVGPTAATLRATVNAKGQGVRACEFEWGINPFSAGSTPGTDLAVTQLCGNTPADTGAQTVTASLRGLAPHTRYYFRVLFLTYGGYVVANARSFVTPAAGHGGRVPALPNTRILAASISPAAHTARFRLGASGPRATRFVCALAPVRHGKAGPAHFHACRAPVTYRRLRPGLYQFSVRAGDAHGYGPVRTRRFRI